MCIEPKSKQFFPKKTFSGRFLAIFWLFLLPGIYFWSPEFISGPMISVPSVRPSGIYFLTARRIFLLFFLMDSSWEGAKTYRARFLNFSFFAPVKVQKHLFFVLFFKFLKNREVKFFYFLIFYSSRRAGHFCFLVRDRSVETSP